MSDNFYPPPRALKPKHYIAVAALVAVALCGGLAAGYWLAAPPPENPIAQTRTDQSVTATTTTDITEPIAMPASTRYTEGELLAYRLDAEIEGGGTDTGEYSEVFMNFGTDVTLYTRKVETDGSADLRFVFENTGLAGTFFDEPFEWRFDAIPPDSDTTATQAPASDQTAFLTTPIEMHVGPDGEVESISSPGSLKDLLGTIVTVPHLEFPEGELTQGKVWETRLKLPVPGLGNAVDTTIINTLSGQQRIGNHDCGVVHQVLGATATNTTASAPADSAEKPMLLSVPLFGLTGENTIYFDLQTGRLIHAVLDMDFELQIKEQLGAAGPLLQQFMPGMMGEKSAPGLEQLVAPGGKPDLMNLSLTIDGAMSLVNEGVPAPLPTVAEQAP